MSDGTAALFPKSGSSSGSMARASVASSPASLSVRRKRNRTSDTGDPPRVVQLLNSLDVTGMALGVLLTFVVSYLLGRHRIFWEDEMLGWMLLRDPSWAHMIRAWHVGADGGGFAFYLTGRGWFALFGPSETSFRFYAATGFSLAFCTAWVAARRFYSRAIVAFALFDIWFCSVWLVTRMAEGRFYGLLTLSAALAVFLVMKADAVEGTPASLGAAAFGAHAILSTSHLLGFVYSANLLFGLWLTDRLQGRSRPALYLSGAAAWLLLIPEKAAIAASAAVGKPHFWTQQPTLYRFLGAYTGFSSEIALVEVLLLAIAAYSLSMSPVGWRVELRTAFRRRLPVYVVGLVLFFVPVEMVAEGMIGPSLFINRYLMPLALAQVFLVAEACTLIAWGRLPSARAWRNATVRMAATLFFAAGLVWWVFGHISRLTVSPEDFTQEIAERLPHDLPVLCEDALVFIEVIGRQHDLGVHFMYMLDWPFAVSAEAPRAEVTQYHLMENWQKAGYFSGSIEQRELFLQEHPKFIVLQGGFSLHRSTAPEISSNPLVERFAIDPAYQVLPYGPKTKSGVQDTWLVCRGGC